ncbi:choice-of-anchor Q domain-containing protein [Paracidovorax cattleyae]|uniref:Polymorphic outer membrane protein repeat-containing protein n=1 Tax=Paracidovorax cattleyae TaxID=80868 RepID=A0A1H0VA55_9BURK|nr:choice-of-anchor Q domain-containing protein [Paracidovorax cattleyae]SDP75449.1 polymorphic outer membrane protein repeat-containing protein [Paracidovorax cattleyae]
MRICGTQITGSTGRGNGGGAHLWVYPPDRITIGRTTVANNHAEPNGRNSTFQGHSAKSCGGAIFGDGHQDSNVTFAGNGAGGHGGALYGKNFTLRNTVFVDNTAGDPWKQALSCSTTGTGDHVVQWQTSTANGGGDRCIRNVTAANPVLAAPADNGGPTPTMLPGSGSALPKPAAGCEATDQRGVARDTSRCDIGAVEVR